MCVLNEENSHFINEWVNSPETRLSFTLTSPNERDVVAVDSAKELQSLEKEKNNFSKESKDTVKSSSAAILLSRIMLMNFSVDFFSCLKFLGVVVTF